MDYVEQAVQGFQSGHSCSQAVLAAFAPAFGVDKETALKIAAGFGGGMGRMAETCGAVTGAFMVLGLSHPGSTAERPAKEAVYARVKQFAERFKACHGALDCRDLLGCDMSTPEGAAKVQELKLPATICPKFVRTAAEILQEMCALT